MPLTNASPQADGLRRLRRLSARGALQLKAALQAPAFLVGRWRAREPNRLLIAPQDIRTCDPTVAADIYAGYYAFGGKIVNAHGRSPFSLEPPSAEWARALTGFGWLRHLRAADSSLARANARALAREFIAVSDKTSMRAAWAPEVVARRTMSWLSQSPMLLEGADSDHYRQFLRALTRGYWLLRRHAEDPRGGESRLTAAIAATAFALCVQDGAPLLKRAIRSLEDRLRLQILPDGAPISRNPQKLVELLFDLLPLRQAFAARGQSPPPDLLNAIDRMTPALRMFRHGDGSLALFNGMSVTAPERIAIALSYAAAGQPIVNARHSGYQRLEAHDALALFDVGRPPPALYSRLAHAGCLAFEFSLGSERIIVNCGSPGPRRPDLRELARATAAHSTLVVNDASSCVFSPPTSGGWFDDEIVAGPENVAVSREETPSETSVVASHDGYSQRFGVVHERRLTLQADGRRLRGRDRLVPVRADELGSIRFAIRFHLHPLVAAAPTQNGAGVLLRTASGSNLLFEAPGHNVGIEDSIFFAAAEGSRPSRQIVIHGSSPECSEVAWSLELLPVTPKPDERYAARAD